MTAEASSTPASEERLLAMLAHLFGFVIALIIWAVQKDKSQFVRFQALQAVAFDAALFASAIVASCLLGVAIAVLTVVTAAVATTTQEPGAVAAVLAALFLVVWLLGMGLTLLLVVASLVARVVAAVSVYQGRNYHHPWLGNRVERMLGARQEQVY